MKILSLFDGISCARVALERAGIPVTVYFASEIDKYAIQISEKNYPDIVHVGDIRLFPDYMIQFNNESYTDLSKDIDLLIGGSPCQDLSIAKKDRKGLDGERSGLFWEYVRILKEVKPKYFILENVNSMPKEAKELITKTLGVEPIMINAALVSAQNRKRLFWVGKRVGLTVLEGQPYYEKVEIPQPEDRGILLKDILEGGYTPDEKTQHPITASYFKAGQANFKEERNGHKRQGVYSDESVYQYRRTYWRETKGGKVPTLTANMGTGGNNVPYVAEPVALRNRGNGKKPEYNGSGKANSLTTVQTDSMVDMPPIRKLSPIECERLQGLPDNYTEGVSNTQRYKALGNAFNVDVVAHIIKHLL